MSFLSSCVFLFSYSTTVGSDIVGASLQCGKKQCIIDNDTINITIIFQHDPLSEVSYFVLNAFNLIMLFNVAHFS